MTQEGVYKKGLAIGRSDIVSDCWHFRFFEEVFTVKLRNLKTTKYRGYIVAKVEDIRNASNASGASNAINASVRKPNG